MTKHGKQEGNAKPETAAFNKNPRNAGWVIFIGGVGGSAPRPARGALTPPMKKNHTPCCVELLYKKLNL